VLAALPSNTARPQSFAVLFVADLFHPVDGPAVERFLNGDVGHRRGRRCSVPMPKTGRKPDHIAGPHLLDRSALALHPAEARRDDQSLAERMRMPGGAGTRLECDACATDACRIGCLEQWVHADRAGEVFCRSLREGCEPPRVICIVPFLPCVVTAGVCAAAAWAAASPARPPVAARMRLRVIMARPVQ
jgi:hypothetical protein